MFCPRCGRPVSRTANFCGGCGLPRAEVERLSQVQPVVQPEEKNIQPEINDINATLSQLEGDLSGVNPVENYTTDKDINTNAGENSFDGNEVKLEFEDITRPKPVQPVYSADVPVYPYYSDEGKTLREKQQEVSASGESRLQADQNLSTVDFVWMLLISGLPVIGLLYLIYQGFIQQDNVNRRSWARATMLISLFVFALVFVFCLGLTMTTLLYW